MVISHRAFLIELYEEYLEEASFLYEQRRTLLYKESRKFGRKLANLKNASKLISTAWWSATN